MEILQLAVTSLGPLSLIIFLAFMFLINRKPVSQAKPQQHSAPTPDLAAMPAE
jgi:hypothetical protein